MEAGVNTMTSRKQKDCHFFPTFPFLYWHKFLPTGHKAALLYSAHVGTSFQPSSLGYENSILFLKVSN